MKRKLASLQTVLSIEAIPNADAIVLARIQGWQCVVKKDEFRPGDCGVFLEIDSVPPDDPRYEFLWRPKDNSTAVPRPESFRLRTVRLRGVLSQGLLLPLAHFPELPGGLATGADVTECLHIKHWEAQLRPNDEVEGPFLPGVPKTDEMRVQSMPQVLDELAGRPYAITLKCDGTSATYGFHPRTGAFTVCGRNWSIKRGPNSYWRAAEKYQLETALAWHPGKVVQAELVGPGIQKNRLGLQDIQLAAFSVYDQNDSRFLGHDEASTFLASINVPQVAVVEEGESFAHDQASLLSLAEGHYPGTKNEREGIVIRPRVETFSPALGGRLSFKAISNRYLLKGGE